MTQPDKAALLWKGEEIIHFHRDVLIEIIRQQQMQLAALRSADGMRETVEFPKTIFTHPSATAEGDKAAVPIISNVKAGGMNGTD